MGTALTQSRPTTQPSFSPQLSATTRLSLLLSLWLTEVSCYLQMMKTFVALGPKQAAVHPVRTIPDAAARGSGMSMQKPGHFNAAAWLENEQPFSQLR